MPNFGIPRRAASDVRDNATPLNWRRGLFRIWLLMSAGWIMGWTIYLLLEGVQGGLTTTRDMIVVPILLFAPPVALWIFGLAAGWAIRGFDAE